MLFLLCFGIFIHQQTISGLVLVNGTEAIAHNGKHVVGVVVVDL